MGHRLAARGSGTVGISSSAPAGFGVAVGGPAGGHGAQHPLQ